MQYVVFHATINTTEFQAYLEFFISHIDGTPISSEAEKQRVIMCLRAAIERRVSKVAVFSIITLIRFVPPPQPPSSTLIFLPATIIRPPPFAGLGSNLERTTESGLLITGTQPSITGRYNSVQVNTEAATLPQNVVLEVEWNAKFVEYERK
ncbi:ACT domain-containing protein [Artemisia annua]|uniref:ACT domain-containing protein ACR n=1 Tax=Artemisia annua TaxID=35608 RepID=A0A2U1LJZ5_ARTAN|nr:ACT domain-containing protein [Artemisia annua]